MKVVLPGGSGQIGTLLAREFHAQGHEVVVLSRKPAAAPWRVARWDTETPGDWAAELDRSFDAFKVISYLRAKGAASADCRYNAANRREILDSRVQSTRAVGQAIARSARPPRVWLRSSTCHLYAHRYDGPPQERRDDRRCRQRQAGHAGFVSDS